MIIPCSSLTTHSTTNTFFENGKWKIMEEFEVTWQALVENGSCQKHREAVQRYWDTLSPAQQRQASSVIPQKVREGRFVQYDPIRVIKENTRRIVFREPTNYNGKALPSEPVVIAKWNGRWGMYTMADVELFGLEVKE